MEQIQIFNFGTCVNGVYEVIRKTKTKIFFKTPLGRESCINRNSTNYCILK